VQHFALDLKRAIEQITELLLGNQHVLFQPCQIRSQLLASPSWNSSRIHALMRAILIRIQVHLDA
jgi:hypothetical protein